MKEHLINDIHPKSWLNSFQEKSFFHVFLMFLFYSGIGILLASSVWAVEFYVFDFEEPDTPFTLVDAISAGPSEESLFFGIPFALTGNTYVVLITGSIWAAVHLLNIEVFGSIGHLSYTTFVFTLPHIFFSLRTWKSGQGLYAVFLHSAWNVGIFGLLVLFEEIPSTPTESWESMFDIFSLVSAAILLGITIPIYKWRLKREEIKIKTERPNTPFHVKILIGVVIAIIVIPLVGGASATIFFLSWYSFAPDELVVKKQEVKNKLEIDGNVSSLKFDKEKNLLYLLSTFGAEASPELTIIDGDSHDVVDKLSIDIPMTRPLLVIQPSTDIIFLVDNYGNRPDYKSKIHVLDLQTKKQVTQFDFDTNSGPIAFVEDPNIVYVNHVLKNSISVIDIEKNSVIKKIPIGMRPSGLLVNPNTNLVYSSSHTSESTIIIDGTTHQKIDEMTFEHGPGNMVIDEDTNILYLANSGHYKNKGTTISVIDGTTHNILDTIDVKDDPSRILLNPYTDKLYVHKYNDHEFAVIDTNTNKIIETIELGFRPMYMDIDPKTNLIYLAQYSKNYLQVIDVDTNQLVDFEDPSMFDDIPITGKITQSKTGSSNDSNLDKIKADEKVQSIIKPINATFWSNMTTISQGVYTGSSTWCENGYMAISGGVELLSGNLQVIDSVPTGAFYVDGQDEPIPIGWGVGIKNMGTTEGTYMVYVDCFEIK